MGRRESNLAQRAEAAACPPSDAVAQELARLLHEGQPIKELSLSRLSPSQVPPCLFEDSDLSSSLRSLDLSHNNICELPAEIGRLLSMTELNASRNWLRQLPVEIGSLKQLIKLDVHANELRPGVLATEALASLPRLKVLDLR